MFLSSFTSKKLKAIKATSIITLGILVLLLINSSVFGWYILDSYHPVFAVEKTNLVVINGIASGDITDHAAMIWSQTNMQALMHVQYDTDPNFSHSKLQTTPNNNNNSAIITVPSNQTTDFTGHAKIQGLKPDTAYYYRTWFSIPSTSSTVGGEAQKSHLLLIHNPYPTYY